MHHRDALVIPQVHVSSRAYRQCNCHSTGWQEQVQMTHTERLMDVPSAAEHESAASKAAKCKLSCQGW